MIIKLFVITCYKLIDYVLVNYNPCLITMPNKYKSTHNYNICIIM